MGDLINGKFRKIENFEEYLEEEYDFLPVMSGHEMGYFIGDILMIVGVITVVILAYVNR